MGTAVEVKERPILFSGEMVRALLDGRKTETRRVIKRSKKAGMVHILGDCYRADRWWVGPHPHGGWWAVDNPDGPGEWLQSVVERDALSKGFRCPYGQVGDRLWVRETWADTSHLSVAGERRVTYKQFDGDKLDNIPWRSPIFMPRWASRIVRPIAYLRAERVQDITPAGMVAEGFGAAGRWYDGHLTYHACAEASQWFVALWDSINAKRGYPWASNPWVWVIGMPEGVK